MPKLRSGGVIARSGSADFTAASLIRFYVSVDGRVEAVQHALATLTDIAAAEQILIANGTPLDARQPLAAYRLPLVQACEPCAACLCCCAKQRSCQVVLTHAALSPCKEPVLHIKLLIEAGDLSAKRSYIVIYCQYRALL